MRHFRMPPNQSLKNLAILQKHILREISKHEVEDRSRACAGSSSSNGIKRINSSKKHNTTGRFTDKEVRPRIFICQSCNVSSRTVKNHLKHLNTHEKAPLSCIKCKKRFQNNDSFSWHLSNACKDSNRKVIYKCSQCLRKFKCERDITRHLKAHQRNNCPYCKKPITLRKHLIKHLVKFHSIQFEKYIHDCTVCSKRFIKKYSLYSHLQKHFNDKIICLECGNVSSSIEESKKHAEKHNDQKKFECTICTKRFYRKRFYHLHKKRHSLYNCITCNQSCGTREEIRKHKRKGHVVQGLHPLFICPFCPDLYWKKMGLLRHMKTHLIDSGSTIRCKYCDQYFSSLTQYFKHCFLVSHKENITKLPKFRCNVCNKEYLKESLLKQHRQTHDIANEPMKCQYCDFKSYYKQNYERHLGLHVANKEKHTCNNCFKSFSSLAGLKDHVSYNHIQDRKFTCEECGKSFKRISELNRHKKSHSDDRPFNCNVCGAAFKNASHQKRHEKSVHQSTKSQAEISQNENIISLNDIESENVLTETSISENMSSEYSLQPVFHNTAEDLRLVMEENMETLRQATLIEVITDPYNLLVQLATSDILDLSNVNEFR